MKIYAIALLFVMILIAGCSQAEVPATSVTSTTNKEVTTTTLQTTSTTDEKITLEQLSTHTTIDDCWVSFEGKVYDLTSFLPKHPGSPQAILPYCGTADEFTNAFTNKHGMSKVGMLMMQENVGELA